MRPATEAVRLTASLAQCEIALVRRDPVAAALIAQAARHAEGLSPGPLVGAAARLSREVDTAAGTPEAAAARKVVQALVRAAALDAEASLLAGPGGRAR
jgi:hypothetical protein